jgi:hypothetical protein
VFLDFDGVLHPSPCEVDQLFCNLRLLESWLRARPDVGVVISSSWRSVHSLTELKDLFSPDVESRVIGTTPVFNERSAPIDERHREILHWLRARPGLVYRWAILDDQFDRFPSSLPELVATDGDIGLTPSDLRRLDLVLDLGTTEIT